MIAHVQQSSHDKLWLEVVPVDNGNGTVTFPAGQVWVDGLAYALPLWTPTVGTEPCSVHIERTAGGADYVLDQTGEGDKTAFRPTVLPTVLWRDVSNGPLHYLQHT